MHYCILISLIIVLSSCIVNNINSPCHHSHQHVQSDIAVQRYENTTHRSKRGATVVRDLLWPNALIPYSISQRFTRTVYKNIKRSIKIWESNTCLRFVPLTDEIHGLKFEPQECGCCSFVGRQSFGNNKPQEISINGQDCEDVGHMLHEIGHAIGFWHEHVRPDRDRYVHLRKDNIDYLSLHNFKKKNSSEIYSLGEAYDYESIMHYSSRSFSIDTNKKTIVPTKRFQLIGQRVELSIGDIKQANKLYNCKADANQCDVDNGGCQHECIDLHQGYKCRCRQGFVLGHDGKNCILSCNHLYEHAEGLIYSPNYPRKYLPDTTCMWELRAPVGFVIKLYFATFELENSFTCSFDVLNIKRLVNRDWEDVAYLCGTKNRKKIVIRSNTARVRFRSDNSNQKSGFKIFYQFVPTKCSTKPRICHLVPKINQKYYLPSSMSTSYDVLYTLPEGRITLPISRPLSCMLKITLQRRRNIALMVKSMNLSTSLDCLEEVVIVKNPKNDQVISTLCGFMQKHIIYTKYKSIVIEINLNSETSGLELEYFSVGPQKVV